MLPLHYPFCIKCKHGHAEGLLSFVGGKFEIIDGNSDIDALKKAIIREVKEEVNLTIKDDVQYVTSSYFKANITGVNVVNIVFYCKLIKTIPKIIPNPEEVPEYYWLTYDEAISKDNCPEWLYTSFR